MAEEGGEEPGVAGEEGLAQVVGAASGTWGAVGVALEDESGSGGDGEPGLERRRMSIRETACPVGLLFDLARGRVGVLLRGVLRDELDVEVVERILGELVQRPAWVLLGDKGCKGGTERAEFFEIAVELAWGHGVDVGDGLGISGAARGLMRSGSKFRVDGPVGEGG